MSATAIDAGSDGCRRPLGLDAIDTHRMLTFLRSLRERDRALVRELCCMTYGSVASICPKATDLLEEAEADAGDADENLPRIKQS